MKHIKSHFKFSKGQRSGIFLLIVLIIIVQCIYFFVDKPVDELVINQAELDQFRSEVDSLKQIQIEKNKPKVFPFNPNYITDYKGYTLGMSNEEIDRLLEFRAKNKWINSIKDFQKVTKVSDSLLAVISPHFKFPEWVTNPKTKRNKSYSNYNVPKSYSQKIDLNLATAQQLQKVNGIGKAFSARIVKFRNKFPGGFISDVQLQDVYGLSPEVIERITNEFTVKTPRVIQIIKLNEATIDELVTIQHIDYEIAHHIIEQRILRQGYQSLNDLTKVKDFPVNKIEIIKLYLTLN
ncbi:competence protein ComEA [Flavobacteriales bacterium 34_180_T64]|nr:competence protein ComEA [Flavobacteriales bacterium 34_180_T64]